MGYTYLLPSRSGVSIMDPLPIAVIMDNDHLDKCLSEIFEYEVNEISDSLTRIKPKMPIKIEALKIAFEAQSAFMNELNTRMSSNEDAIKVVRQRLAVSTNVKEELDSRMENDTKKIKECMRHLTHLRKETRNINAENDVLVEKKKCLLESTTSLHSEIHKLHVYAKTLNKRRSLADGRISYLDDTIAHLSTMEEDLNNKIDEKKRSIESLTQRLHDAEIAFEKANVSATEAEERTAIATKHMSTLCTMAINAESDVLAAQERLKNAEEESLIAQEKACAAQEKACVAKETARIAEETTRISEDNVVSCQQRVVAATERLSSMQKHLSALQKKASAAEKRARALERKVEESDEYLTMVPNRMTNIASKRSLVSRLDEIISSQEEIIASRERQLKMNLHTIIHRDKDLIRSQNVISRLHQEISEMEMDITQAKEYAHRKRLSILNHSLQEIS